MDKEQRAGRFILNALHLDQHRLNAGDFDDLDWESVLQHTQIHRLGPMLHRRLIHFDSHAPDSLKDYLKNQYRHHALRNLRIYRELADLTQKLNDAGIDSIALKGTYLARFVYPELGLRPMRDLDILVPKEDVVRAFELLIASGYRQVSHSHESTWLILGHHLPGLKSPSGILIELHHGLVSPNQGEFLPDIWQRRIMRKIGETPVYFLCPEDLLLHLCLHAALEHKFNLGPLALTDIAFLIGTHAIDWDDFRIRVPEGKWCRSVQSVLHMAMSHVGAEVPEDWAVKQADWMESAERLMFPVLYGDKLSRSGLLYLYGSMGLMDKVKLIFKRLFISRMEISRDYDVHSSSPLIYICYFKRWRRLLAHYMPSLFTAYLFKMKVIRPLAQNKQNFSHWLETGESMGCIQK